MKSIKSLVLVASYCLLSLTANAFPIAVSGTEGLSVVVSSTSDVIATYEGNSAAYSNDLYLENGGFGFVFNNHLSAVGSTVNLGSFPIGTELIFRLHVNNTGYDYYSGPSSRNPDGHEHARVEADWAPNTTLVSFEDLYNGPFDYNDLSFSFTSTKSGPAGGTTNTVPEIMSTSLWLGIMAFGSMVAARRRR